MARPNRLLIQPNKGLPAIAMPGDGPFLNLAPTALSTAGAGTVLAALLASGLIIRTGPTGAVADTIDTGANIDTAFPDLAVGDTLDVFYANQVNFVLTHTAATGVTLKTAAGNNAQAAFTTRLLHFVKTGTATYDMYVI